MQWSICKFLEPKRIYYCRRTTISQVNLMGGCVRTWAGGGSLVPGPLVLVKFMSGLQVSFKRTKMVPARSPVSGII